MHRASAVRLIMLTNLQPVHRPSDFFPGPLLVRLSRTRTKVQSFIPRAREMVLVQLQLLTKLRESRGAGTTIVVVGEDVDNDDDGRDHSPCVPGEPKLAEQQAASRAGKKLGAEWLSGSIDRQGASREIAAINPGAFN